VVRLAEDHANARRLADGLAALERVTLDPERIETNIVLFEVPDAPALVRSLSDQVELLAADATHVRAVTHLDVDELEIDQALAAIAAALA
jgi:threonine aldolase